MDDGVRLLGRRQSPGLKKLEPGVRSKKKLAAPSVESGPGTKRLRRELQDVRLRHEGSQDTRGALLGKKPLSQKARERALRGVDYASALTLAQLDPLAVEALAADLSAKLGVPIRVDWSLSADSMWVEKDAREIVIPGGAARRQGASLDVIALQVLHEAAHVLFHHDEATADDWAAREGLRLCFGPIERSADELQRWLKAAYVALLDQVSAEASLDPSAPLAPLIRLFATGYAPLQGRFDLYRAGILGFDRPALVRSKHEHGAYPELATRADAAKVLGVPEDVLDRLGAIPGGLQPIDLDGVVYYDRERVAIVALLARNKAQLALAQAEGGADEASILGWIDANSARFAARFEVDPVLRRLVFSEWQPDTTPSFEETLALWRARPLT